MNAKHLTNLITVRLEHMATQVESLIRQGRIDDAMLLREEGLHLADAFDREEDFIVLDYLSV